LREDPSLRKEINATLQKEGLNYDGRVEIRHLLDIFHKDVGIDQISQRISKTFEGPKIATHYGCHILRPRQVVQFDDPEEPTIFDTLVEVTGAESVDWKDKVKCCGAPVWGINDDLSMDLIEKKITDARQSGAEYLCVSCAYCQLQFDRVQKMLNEKRNKTDCLPSILYTQLLGLCLGVDAEILGIHQNELSISGIMDCLS
jgi:heterodisulfide reductase subunit B